MGRKLFKKIAAFAISGFMVFTCVPSVAFGASGSTQDAAALKTAMETAQKKMNTAKAEMEQAEKDLAAYDDKKAAAEYASAKAKDAEDALAAGEKERDDAFAKAKSDAQAALDNAVTDLETAQQNYRDAEAAVEARSGELDEARQAKKDAEEELAGLKERKEAQQALAESLSAEIETAQAAVDTATGKWEQDKAAAATAVEEAQAAADAAGYDFINNKINALGDQFFTLEEMTEICKGYTDANFANPVTFNGNTISTLADAANDASFSDIVKSHCTKENLLLAMDMIDRSNELRETENKSVMGVSYQLMGVAIMSDSFTAYSTGHTLFNKNGKTPEGYTNTDSFWAIGPATWGNENLYYSSVKIADANKPYVSWYDKEKAALQKAVDSGQFPGLSMDLSTREIWTDYPNVGNAGFGQVGHYLTLKNEEYTTTGAAAGNYDGDLPVYPDGWSGHGRATQTFNDDTANSISVDQCRREINAAFADVDAALAAAQENQTALETKPEAVSSAEAALEEKQQALTKANDAVAELNGKISAKNEEISTLAATISKKEAALGDANTAKNNAAKAVEAAEAEKDVKAAANTKAQALDVEDPTTYADEEFAALQDLAEAVGPLKETAEQERSAAQTAEEEAAALKPAYDEANNIYQEKKTAYDNAKKAYDTAKASYEAARNIAKATVKISAVTYTGKARKPAPTVTLNGKTLKSGTDYTVAYANNVKAGTATATITGKGIYKGTVKKSFNIKKAANPLTVKGKPPR